MNYWHTFHIRQQMRLGTFVCACGLHCNATPIFPMPKMTPFDVEMCFKTFSMGHKIYSNFLLFNFRRDFSFLPSKVVMGVSHSPATKAERMASDEIVKRIWTNSIMFADSTARSFARSFACINSWIFVCRWRAGTTNFNLCVMCDAKQRAAATVGEKHSN